jgi:virginiamycin B lyase
MRAAKTLAGALTVFSLSAIAWAAPPLAARTPALAQSQGPAAPASRQAAALTGQVTSQEEGPMEGVVVSAKRQGGTIMVSVDSNAQGQYAFPKDRLEPGLYDVTMRAIGYVLPATTATVAANGPTVLNLRLTKATQQQLALQMSNSEWMQSAPGAPALKTAELRCLDCHGLQRPMFSKDNAQQMALTVQRMGAHAANAAPDFPFFLQNASQIMSQPPSKGEQQLGAYIASINLSSGPTWSFPLKTIPRPMGKATQVIVTTYDLPGLTAPHDTLLDKQGNVWFSDFQEQYISKLDPKTGKVTRYPVPILKPGYPTGALMITMDKDGDLWAAMMGQAEIAKLDPKTGKVTVLRAPDWNKGDTRFTMIDALHSNVDGKLWTKTNGGPDPSHGNKLYQVDLATGKFTEIMPPPGKRDIAAYGLVSDLDNNVYGLDNNPNEPYIWRTDAKTGKTYYINVINGGGRRGHIDSQNRLWFSQFYANRYGMYDPKTNKVTLYQVPVPYAGTYDVQYDDKKYVWGADMGTDLAERLDPSTGEWVGYLLPLSINSRHIDVQKNPNGLSSLWTEGQQDGKIVHVEPLSP